MGKFGLNAGVYDIAERLFTAGEISLPEYIRLKAVLGRGDYASAKAAARLFRAGKISLSEYDRLRKIRARADQASTKAEVRAKLKEAERFATGSGRHPNMQGGLPSLGKRR